MEAKSAAAFTKNHILQTHGYFHRTAAWLIAVTNEERRGPAPGVPSGSGTVGGLHWGMHLHRKGGEKQNGATLIPSSPKRCQLDDAGKDVTGTTTDETPSSGCILNGCLFLFSILCCLV